MGGINNMYFIIIIIITSDLVISEGVSVSDRTLCFPTQELSIRRKGRRELV